MGNNQHLKRHSAPTSWKIKRKNITFIAKPNSGSMKSKYVVPVVVLLRDVLNYAQTMKEVKLIIHNEEVLVNGKRVQDHKYPIGMFDVVEIKKTSEKFVILFNEFGKLKTIATKDNLIYLKLAGKTVFKGGNFQLNFMNGFNLIVNAKAFAGINVNDTVVYDFIKKKVSSVINLKEGAAVYLFDGKFKGHFAIVKSFVSYNGVTRDLVNIEYNNEAHSTAKDYCYVVGSNKNDLKRFA